MEELGSMWNYQEDYGHGYDELKLKLQCTTIELESAKLEANEQIRKHRDEVDNLVNLLKLVYQERDEARDQLQKLANPMFPNHLMVVPRANSSTTVSNTLSDTYTHHSHGSSPVTSPEFSSMNMADHSSFATTMFDPASATTAVDNLVKGKTLPEKGKLLQAVMETSPLLETLLVAGPLPRWKNPPPLHTFRLPPVKAVANADSTIVLKRMSSSQTYPRLTRGQSNGVSSRITEGKRQRFQ